MNEIEDNDDNESELSSMGSIMSLNELCGSSGALSFRSSSIRRNRWISRFVMQKGSIACFQSNFVKNY